MRLDPNVEIEIAVAAAIRPFRTLAGDAQLLSVRHALRDAHLHSSRDAMRHALFVVLDDLEIKLDFGALECLFEREAHGRLVIAARACAARAAAMAAGETGEKIGEV